MDNISVFYLNKDKVQGEKMGSHEPLSDEVIC